MEKQAILWVCQCTFLSDTIIYSLCIRCNLKGANWRWWVLGRLSFYTRKQFSKNTTAIQLKVQQAMEIVVLNLSGC
jgi:hypothetical protein